MSVILVTGSAGLIGTEAVRFFATEGFDIIGIDNDMRRVFFGEEASTAWSRQRLEIEVRNYRHVDGDIRDIALLDSVFARYGNAIVAVIHTATQPSHDWAAGDPQTDFTVNANGTLNLLEAARRHCPRAAFVFTSTNKVYGDAPNALPLVEQEQRWEVSPEHPFAAHGIDESMSVDSCLHSLFGASKLAADVLVQEYGRYFGMRTACFRGGCLTGPGHAGTKLHGFLAYLARCAVTGAPYTVLGYKAAGCGFSAALAIAPPKERFGCGDGDGSADKGSDRAVPTRSWFRRAGSRRRAPETKLHNDRRISPSSSAGD
jgi:CDP-paratose 2-epimerase